MKKLLVIIAMLLSFAMYGQDFNAVCMQVGLKRPPKPIYTCCFYGSSVIFQSFELGEFKKTFELNMIEYLDVINIEKDNIYALKVGIGIPQPPPFYSSRMWIDFDKDGVFQDDEQIYCSGKCKQERNWFQTFIAIPDTLTGYYLMRIVVVDGYDWCVYNHPLISDEQTGNREGIYADIILKIK